MNGYTIRDLAASEVNEVLDMYKRFTQEILRIASTLTTDHILRDGFGKKFSMAVAECTNTLQLVGFVAWQCSYDLHWGTTGATVLDLYVLPEHRCRGLAPLMLQRVASLVKENGGTFLSGQSIVNPTHPQRLYRRIAVEVAGAECILGGRAFRAFAELESESLKRFVKGLPPKEWNYTE